MTRTIDPHAIDGKFPAPATRFDVVVVGAGRSGTAAALAAAQAGQSVLLVDENPVPGHQIGNDVPLYFGGRATAATQNSERMLETLFMNTPELEAVIEAGVELLLGTCAWGVYRNGPLVGSLPVLIALWAVIGFGFSLTQTPIGRIINRSAREADRGAVFAAQFALSHACWLVTYPLAGWIGAGAGLTAAALVLAGIGSLGLVAVLRIWPTQDASEMAHDHPDLPPDHPHLAEHGPHHAHTFVIDDLHRRWPRAA